MIYPEKVEFILKHQRQSLRVTRLIRRFHSKGIYKFVDRKLDDFKSDVFSKILIFNVIEIGKSVLKGQQVMLQHAKWE